MLVHRNRVFREGLALLLEWKTKFKESIQVGSFAKARKALGSLEGKAELAIVELDQPECNGEESVRELLGEADVPVLALSTSQDPQRLQRASEIGADRVLNPKISVEEIIAAARDLWPPSRLARRHRIPELRDSGRLAQRS